MSLYNHHEVESASFALVNWMVSQQLDPVDGVILLQYTLCRLMVKNAESYKHYDALLQDHKNSMSELHSILKEFVGKPS